MSKQDAVPSAAEALPDPADADNVVYNPDEAELREFSAHLETTTEFGSPAYVSEQRSRSSDRTKNDVDDEFERADYDRITEALSHAREDEMLCIDRQVGRHPEHTYHYRYYVPKEYGRIALAVTRLFEPAPADAEPDFLTVQLPDHDDLAIRAVPDAGVTAVLGSDYTGEAKKAALRLFMYRAKRAGGLGLHAGSKRVTVHDDEGDLRTVGQVFLGLSGTGKSTLTAHGLGLDDPEDAVMVQDDVCALLPNGTVAGSEGNGLYLKTIGLDADEQPEVYDAVTHETAVLENVDVADDGTVDFDSETYTSNGRAAVLREHLDSAAEEIDLERAQQVFFITRNPTMPPVVKLPADAAAAAFMLGESIQTSAGDPSSAGEAIRVVGTNPFIVGSEGEEGNRFRDLVDDLGVECYVLNTGYLGEKAKSIGVEESTTILREISRGRVEWDDAAERGFAVPTSVPGMDIEAYDVADYVEDYDEKRRELRAERRDYLESFDDLDEGIVENVY
ncbi:phosphoenolpyruvate carboxykinase (ATP) [Halarchaeum rubridurum]|uniref:phosphoenolpyruvate carboxykinase (ATP) n=1 Tax=Halarchaeum rubridurum TaxID=489911 RepID=A0A830FYK9_9EURY|nr:phosphoenolpyruvate carboxykinase (ATP) [Halarchaeum rubridurum]MBP1954512.1 phosphoenolpyruvate carboxykinase (ATP) [Halarchaeum rubridurum]GGM61727.1 hypothetical protein GCM10009017_09680 [Halarchaeum rubridurum]